MKIGYLNNGATKSKLVSALITFTNEICENSDEKKGYAFYRGCIRSEANNIISINLLGSDIKGSFNLVRLSYSVDKSAILGKVNGFVNDSKLLLSVENLLSVIDKITHPISVIYFDFNEKADISASTCHTIEDLSDPGSIIVLVETDRSLVDTYMLKNASFICPKSLICENWSLLHTRLANFRNTKEERSWFESKGLKV